MIAAGHTWVLADLLEDADLDQGLVPAAGVEQQLAETGVRLGPANHHADPVGEPLGPAGRRERSLVLIQVAQRYGLIDLQQQSEINQGWDPPGSR